MLIPFKLSSMCNNQAMHDYSLRGYATISRALRFYRPTLGTRRWPWPRGCSCTPGCHSSSWLFCQMFELPFTFQPQSHPIIDIRISKLEHSTQTNIARSSSTVVGHHPHHPEVEGSSPVASAGTGRLKMVVKSQADIKHFHPSLILSSKAINLS